MGEARHIKFGTQINHARTRDRVPDTAEGSRDLCTFSKITDNMSEMVQNRSTDTMED